VGGMKETDKEENRLSGLPKGSGEINHLSRWCHSRRLEIGKSAAKMNCYE